MSAALICSGMTRVFRPMSSGLPAGVITMRCTFASQEISSAANELMTDSAGPLVARIDADPNRSVPSASRSAISPWFVAAVGFCRRVSGTVTQMVAGAPPEVGSSLLSRTGMMMASMNASARCAAVDAATRSATGTSPPPRAPPRAPPPARLPAVLWVSRHCLSSAPLSAAMSCIPWVLPKKPSTFTPFPRCTTCSSRRWWASSSSRAVVTGSTWSAHSSSARRSCDNGAPAARSMKMFMNRGSARSRAGLRDPIRKIRSILSRATRPSRHACASSGKRSNDAAARRSAFASW